LVLAARPAGEHPSLYLALKAELECTGYDVSTVEILDEQPESFYEEKAKEILIGLS
jgi:hypothetical protein